MTSRCLLVGALALFVSACASSAPEPRAPQGPAAGIDRAERLLAQGRKLRTDRGCEAAAPTLRVIASFGKGHEVAQSELGACLLEMSTSDVADASLFRDEGLLWLRRAAWGGEARAQRTLANTLSGATTTQTANIEAAPAEALGWALVYEKNAAHKLYGLDPIDPDVMAHLRGVLSPDAAAKAEAFAGDFAPVALATFTPPAREGAEGRGGRAQAVGAGEQRRRRPR